MIRGVLIVCLCAVALGLAPEEKSAPTTNSIGMKLVPIAAGEFLMGTPQQEAEAWLKKVREEWYRQSPLSEWPERRVRISKAFYLSAHETTLGQFRKFVEATGYRTDAERDGKGGDGKVDGKWTTRAEFNWRDMGYARGDDEPVLNVTWNDAVAFCEWLSKAEGAVYRLPTDAEWEYACRAGTTGTYPWGPDASGRDAHAWSSANSEGGPHAVGKLKPNAWGLYDMLGNAYEYCSDFFSTETHVAELVVDPKGPARGEEIVVRGASWGTNPMHFRSAFRGGAGKTHRNMRDGFRVVREVKL